MLETAWPQDMRTRSTYYIHHLLTYLAVCFWYLGAIHHLFICLIFVPLIALRVKVVAQCPLPFVQGAHVTQFACHSSAPVVAAATATTHNRGMAATTAVAGTGCFSCDHPYIIFACATRLLIMLRLRLLNTLKQVV